MSKTWVVSDYHYGHKNIAGPNISNWSSGYRDFNSVNEMNQAIIRSTNELVKREDTLYFLGDWSFGPESNIYEFRDQLLVDNIIMIWGNHDQAIRKNYRNLFTETHELLHRTINGTKFVMCHYPIARWDGYMRGAIHLFGHEHHHYDNGPGSLDVGWCKWRRPLELSEAVSKIIPVQKGSRHEV